MRSRVLSSFTLQQSCVLDPVEVLKMFVCVKCNMNRHLLVLSFSYYMCVTLAAPTLTVPQNESGVIYRTDNPVFLFHEDVGEVNGSYTGPPVVGSAEAAKAVVGSAEAAKAVVGKITQSPERKLLGIEESIKDIGDDIKTLVDVLTNFNGTKGATRHEEHYETGEG